MPQHLTHVIEVTSTNLSPLAQTLLEDNHENTNKTCKKTRALLLTAPLITSIAETSEVAVEIHTIQGQQILNFITPNTSTSYFIMSSYFLQTLALNTPATIQGMNETYDMFKTHKLPNDWPALSNYQEYTALLLASVCTGYAAFADCIASVYFITDLGFNEFLAYCVGGSAAFTNIFCEGVKVYQIARELVANKPRLYSNNVSRYLTPVLGYPLILVNGMQDVIWSYSPIAAKFNLITPTERWGFFSASLANGISDICFTGGINLDTLDAVFGEIFNGRCPELKKLFAAVTAIIWASVPADLIRRQTVYFLLSSSTALPFTLPAVMIELLALFGAVSTAVSFSKSTYQHFLYLSQITHNVLNQSFRVFRHYFSISENKPPTPPPPDSQFCCIPVDIPLKPEAKTTHPPNTPLQKPESSLPSPQQKNYRFFKPAPPPITEKPRESYCAKIMNYFGLK